MENQKNTGEVHLLCCHFTASSLLSTSAVGEEPPQEDSTGVLFACFEAELSGDVWGGLCGGGGRDCSVGRKIIASGSVAEHPTVAEDGMAIALQMQLPGTNGDDSSALLEAVRHLSSRALPGWSIFYPPSF